MNRRRTLSTVLFFGLCFCVVKVKALSCYVCKNAATNEECNQPTNLKECDKDASPTLDICHVKVTYSEGKGKAITKECGVGPCEISGMKPVVNFERNCDRSKPKWRCEYCCQSDRCNKSEGSGLAISTGFLTAVLCAVRVLLPT